MACESTILKNVPQKSNPNLRPLEKNLLLPNNPQRQFSFRRYENYLVPSGACGTGWSEPWVRDSYGNADFTDACRIHDNCYDTCGKLKDHCDSAFHDGLLEACKSGYPSLWHTVQRTTCFGIADTYRDAVHRMGGDAYRAAQRESQCG